MKASNSRYRDLQPNYKFDHHKTREALAAKFQYNVQALGKFFQAQQQAEHRAVVTRAPKHISEAAYSITAYFTRKIDRRKAVWREP